MTSHLRVSNRNSYPVVAVNVPPAARVHQPYRRQRYGLATRAMTHLVIWQQCCNWIELTSIAVAITLSATAY